MDFLKKNYDKIVLGLLLLVFAWQLLGFVQGVNKFNNEVNKKNINKRFKNNESADVVEAIDKTKTFYLNGRVDKSLTSLYKITPEDKSWIVGEFFNCVNDGCKKLLRYTTDADFKCPHCHTAQPQSKGYVKKVDDEDKDGLPVAVENKYVFLNDKNANDAKLDFDGDGFPNVIEFNANTALDDAKSHPPLANLLRYKGVKVPTLGLKIGEINADDNDLQNSSFEVMMKRKGSWRTRYDISVNKRFRVKRSYFKVLKIIKVAAVEEFSASVYKLELARLTLENGKEKIVSTFIVPANSKDIKSKRRLIGFQYLRNQDDYKGGPRAVMLKETFVLNVKKDGSVVSEETYRVDSLKDGKVNISLLKDGKAISKHVILKFDEELDTKYLNQRRDAEEKSAENAEKTPEE